MLGIALVVVLWVGILFMEVGFVNLPHVTPSYTEGQTIPPFSSCLSTDPDFPTILQNETALYENYGSGGWYYYRTGLAEAGKYHVVWAQSTVPGTHLPLAAYSDANYINMIAATINDYKNWVLMRPNSPQNYYIRLGGVNYGYIEWEVVNRQLPLGSTVNGSLSGAEVIEAYQVVLSSDIYYSINLTVPPGANFDLFIYYLAMGDADGGAGYSCIAGSGDGGVGEGEALIRRKLGVTGIGLLIVVWRSGAGSYSLTFKNYYGSDDSIPISPLLSVIGVFLAVVWIKYGRGKWNRRVDKGRGKTAVSVGVDLGLFFFLQLPRVPIRVARRSVDSLMNSLTLFQFLYKFIC